MNLDVPFPRDVIPVRVLDCALVLDILATIVFICNPFQIVEYLLGGGVVIWPIRVGFE